MTDKTAWIPFDGHAVDHGDTYILYAGEEGSLELARDDVKIDGAGGVFVRVGAVVLTVDCNNCTGSA